MNLTQKIAVAAGALVLTATGIAAAGSPPDAADQGLTNAEENVGANLPVANGAASTVTEADDADATTQEAEDAELESQGTGPVDNHGAEVSPVAKSDATTGRAHGEAVSAVARENHGAEVRAANEQSTAGAAAAGDDADDDDEDDGEDS